MPPVQLSRQPPHGDLPCWRPSTALREDQRALLLHHVDGMTVAELADAGGRSVSATESALARARRAFRRLYHEYSEGWPGHEEVDS